MDEQRIDRRTFIQGSSLAAACAALGEASAAPASGAAPAPLDPSKILNYNPAMGYRRLGKTGLMISEVSLGGHGAGGYDQAAVENRAAVLERAAELGLNYVDTNICEECALYGKAMRGKRDRWHIGVGSWPEKLTTEHEANLSPEGMMREIENRLRDYSTDMVDIWRPVGATWGEGQTNIQTLLMISDRVLDMVVAVFEKAKAQGKVRHLAVSAHNPKVFRRVLEAYPQFSAIIFPYLFLTKELGGDSLLELSATKDVGVIGLKPFGAGLTFGIKKQNEVQGKIDKRAHVLVKEMLREKRITAIIPGVNVPAQLEENVKGSYERGAPPTEGDKQAFNECIRTFHASLTPEYAWLRHWEVV
jgi:aryl-alcohol dehydrogenase-like predicted oxidoreductase